MGKGDREQSESLQYAARANIAQKWKISIRANTPNIYLHAECTSADKYIVQYTHNKCFVCRLTAVLPTLVELIPVDDEAGGEVSHSLCCGHSYLLQCLLHH